MELGLSIPQHTSSLCGISTSSFCSENLSMGATIAAPPPLFDDGLRVEIYFKPSIYNILYISYLCFFLFFCSHTSLTRAHPICLSFISSVKFRTFGISERKLLTAMIGKLLLLTNLLLLLNSFSYRVSFLVILWVLIKPRGALNNFRCELYIDNYFYITSMNLFSHDFT